MLSEERKEELKARNLQLVDIVLEKEESCCPAAIDLIGIGGSFCNGDFHEKSDLDLLILSNDDRAKAIDKCFILDGVGHDFYASKWDAYEKKVTFSDPYVTKLIDLDIVYVKNAAALERYMGLQEQLAKNMKEGQAKIKESLQWHFAQATSALQQLKKATTPKEAYISLFRILGKVEFALFMHNKSYVKRGVKRIPEEIARLKKLPEGFLPLYNDAINIHSVKEAQDKGAKLMDMMTRFLKGNGYNVAKKRRDKRGKTEKAQLTSEALTGIYEELFSNYYNKMYHAIDIENKYLSFKAMADAQTFYDEIAAIYLVEDVDLIGRFNPDDLLANAQAFEEMLEKVRKLYEGLGKKIACYDTIEDFKTSYLGEKK